MKKNRLIPILLLKNGWLVQSKNFKDYQNLGNPISAVKRLSQWGSDELIYLDISSDDNFDIKRNDLNYKNKLTFLEIIKEVSSVTFMPISIGGKIKNLKDVEDRFKVGADKVTINTAALEKKEFINQIAKEFGSQCLTISIDIRTKNKKYIIYSHGGKKESKYILKDWLKIVEDNGAGEVLINSIDRDGSGKGLDLELLNYVSNEINIPVIGCGGAGNWEDFAEALSKTKIDAVAAANIFHYRDQSIFLSKKFLFENKLNVRKPDLIDI